MHHSTSTQLRGLGLLVLTLLTSAIARADQAECVSAHANSQILRQQGSLLAARRALLQCAQEGCPGVIAADCADWLADLDRVQPSVVFAVSDVSGRDLAHPRITRIDSEPAQLVEQAPGRAIPLDPGIYRFRVEADGYAPRSDEIVVREAERNRLLRFTLTPLPAAPASTQDVAASPPWAAYALGAAAVASGALAVTFGVMTESKRSTLNRTCALGPPCPDGESLKADGNRYRAIALVAGGVAGAALVAGVITYVMARSGSSAESHALAGLSASPLRRGAELHWQHSF